MRPVIVRLDVLEVARLLESGDIPVQLAHPEVNVRVSVSDGADVAFEVADVDWVEADLYVRDISQSDHGTEW